ncbi:MAG: TetR/AcrR family transcriptional regulator [Emcibacter sp.]|nr:TetR/AcrR family transcriptional regulator [Emcibacter sp.]
MNNQATIDKSPQNGLDEILNKSADLMARLGYHGTSMRDLAHVTGRSLSGLYHYFSNKEELLFLINQRGFTSLLSMTHEFMEQDLTPKERLSRLIHNHVTYFMSHLSEMRVMTSGSMDMNDQRSKILRTLKKEYAEVGQKIVGDYIKDQTGINYPHNIISRKTYLLYGMMNWIFGWYSAKEHGSAIDVADDIFRTFTKGCCNEHSKI